jgi:hypothetical protein
MATPRPFRTTAATMLAILLGMAAFANDPANIPPEELRKSELTYKDTFGPSHDKATKAAKSAEKSEYARKLFDAHQKSANDPTLQEVLRKHALQFAQPTDPVGLAVIADVYKVYQTFPSRRAMATEKLAGLQERSLAAEPAATRAKLAADVVKGYRDAAGEYEKQGNFTGAIAAIGKAKSVVAKYTPGDRETAASLGADERKLQAGAAEQAETERFKAAVAKNPDDAKSKVGLACRYLRYGRNADAAELLKTCGGDWAAVANALAAKPIDPLAASKLLLKAQADLPADDKKSRYAASVYARSLLEEFRAAQADKWPDAVPLHAAVLESIVANEPAAASGQAVSALVQALIEWAEQLVAKFDYTEASNVLVRARTVARTAKPAEAKDLQSDVDAADRVVKACVAIDADVEHWKNLSAKGPLDAKGNLAYGVALLRAGRIAESAKPLELSNIPAFVALSRMLAKGDQAPPLPLADALRTAANELQGGEKSDVLALARSVYEKYLDTNPKDGPEKTRIQLLARELPLNSRTFVPRDYVELLDENPAAYAKLLAVGKSVSGGTASVETKDVYRGKSALRTTPHAFAATDLGYRFTISEAPKKPNEFRYIGFAWKKVGGTACHLQFFDPNGNSFVHYNAGATGTDKLQIRNAVPVSWTYEIQDIHGDFGQLGPFTIGGFQTKQLYGEAMLLDAVYLSKSKSSLERFAPRK